MKSLRTIWEERANRLAARLPLASWQPEVLAWARRERRRKSVWCVAFSGGADSLALLLLLWAQWPARRAQLTALHYNHRLRGAAADRDEEFCRQVCRALRIAFHAGRRHPRRRLKGEEEARELRFEFFGRKMMSVRSRVLWLGQQQNDVAETMLMRLARGSGLAGLAAPRPVQPMSSGRVHLRPLLALKHEELVAALRALRIPWREDDSNESAEFFRNRIRQTVVPAWQAAARRDALAGAALSRSLLAEDEAALEQWLAKLAPIDRRGRLRMESVRGQPRALLRRALHRWLLRQPAAGPLSRQGFEVLLHLLEIGAPTRFSLGTEGFAVIRDGCLAFERNRRKTLR
ncbi:MAG: tRNA lysidine(34) synthetase TilS [Opitutaceae bacterium]|nr:tRNA lysidine(34) synthetase TilS [Opitutaceae bacterium]